MLQTVRRTLFGEPSSRPVRLLPAARGVCTAFAVLALAASPAEAQKITEVVADHAGSPDTYEYIEVAANPASVMPPGVSDTILVDLSSYTILEVDGSAAGGGNPGKILRRVHPGLTNSSGLWSITYPASTLERPVFTILLVSGFTGEAGNDLDEGDDGILDVTPWSAIVDAVAFSDGSTGARTYGAPVLGPGFDGNPTAPGGASRFPYYTDTDSAADWKRNDFDGAGLPGMTGTLVAGEARNTPGTINSTALEDTYANVDPTSQAALRSTIHAAIHTHLRFPYTATTTDTWDILNLADQDPVDSGAILDIYQNETNTKISGGTGAYNREHSWPNSYGFNNNEGVAEYTDCHHLFASDVTWNSNRGNKYFGTCTAACTENATLLNHGFGGGSGTYPGNSNWYNASLYQVWGHLKGDLARAQLYMDVRYEGGTHPYTGAAETNLILTDNPALIVTNAPYMGLLSVLLQWHIDDPVDDAERHRNDIVESFQGNRNPFVDHPEWVDCVFKGTGCQVVAAAPAVTTIAATGATATAATLNVRVNPNGLATDTSFEWGPTTSYGQTTTAVAIGSGAVPVTSTANVSGLAPCSTYHFRATATNTGGTTYGSDLSFTSTCPVPTVTTNAATGVTLDAATLNASVNPNWSATDASFWWGLAAGGLTQATTSVSMGSGSSAAPLTANLTGLTPCKTYDFWVTATNTGGTASGAVLSFPTGCPAPEVTTTTATNVMPTGATLNGSVNPNGVATMAEFEWGPTTSYGHTTGIQTIGSGTSVVPLSAPLSGLVSCAVYHYRVTATSGAGTVTGSDQTFQTTCTGGRLHTVAPCRVLDTRDYSAMVDGEPLIVVFRDKCGIPPTALAVAANVTVTQPSLPGYLSIYPAELARPGTSVVHFGAGITRAAMTIVKLSDDGGGVARLEATVPTGGTVHVIVDVSGYFE